MSGSLSWLTNLFPQALGGTAGAAGAQGYTDIAAAMNPALSGQASIANTAPSYSNQAAASINPNWTAPGASGSGIGGDLSSALKGVNQAANQAGQQQARLPQQQQPVAQSQTGRPSSPQSLSQLLQLMNQRTNMYLGSSNPSSAQPQAQTQRQSGLLGF